MQVGKFLKTLNVQNKIRPCRGEFFLKINKHADQDKVMQRGFFFSKSMHVHARLFGTLEYAAVLISLVSIEVFHQIMSTFYII